MHAPHAYRRLCSSSGIRCHAEHSRYQHGLGISFQREYFLCAGLRFVSSQQLGLLLICSLFGYGLANASCATDFAFPLGLRCCVGFFTHVLIQSFFQQIPVTAFTTTSFTCWLSPPSSYPWQFSRLFLRTGDHTLINCVFFSFVLLWI